MANKIGYVDTTYNPLAMRCTPISEACANCWHLSMANRLARNPAIPADQRAAYAGGPPVMTNRLNDPMHWRKPQRIAVQFMGDLFHEDVPDWALDRIFDRICYDGISHHTWIILTKRHERMLEYTSRDYIAPFLRKMTNIIGMVTAENQKWADIRVPALLQSPFALRGVSIEPMLSGISLKCVSYPPSNRGFLDALTGETEHKEIINKPHAAQNVRPVDWVICGGETGPHARPLHPDWIRSVRDQCVEAGVPLWFKSWGSHIPDTSQGYASGIEFEDGQRMMYVKGGHPDQHLIDGREWKELPQ